MGLTLGSAALWGIAHLWAGRTKTGLVLAGVYVGLLATAIAMITSFRSLAYSLLVRPGWLVGMVIGTLAVAVLWSGVIVSSYRSVRPSRLHGARRWWGIALVSGLCALVATPLMYASRLAYLSQDLVTSVFTADPLAFYNGRAGADPLTAKKRLNILLVGTDAAKNRPGARTDSVTVASIDTRTGKAVLFGLPRNLEHVPFPPGPARDAFPDGFTGDGAASPGLLNEIYQWAEDNPYMAPDLPDGKRGITVLRSTVSGILGLPIDYYAMVDMKGFAQIIDAIGGVTVTVKEDIVYGTYRDGLVKAGTRKLSGAEALWFGRSRTDSDDYVRMSRQKCLLNAIAKQADPLTVLGGFDHITSATKRYVSTDIPQSLLPALLNLSEKVRLSHITSLQFVPPLINTVHPDWPFIRTRVEETLTNGKPPAIHNPTPSRHEASSQASPSTSVANDAVSLDSACE
ncbi:LCP family protein [Acrocarpospora catenulata]|uniref:LCP family protein n=1 Tax=Acrocarpospora catenulata TaxID=2836182 RepID=UPI001BD96137|nr:LCP family protein [Acrocarpospora catenulata]